MRFRFLSQLSLVCVVSFLIPSWQACGAEPKVISVWPSKPPGTYPELPPEGEFTEGGKKIVAGEPIYLLTNVSKPELAIYKPEASKDTGAAVIICPGGGHRVLAYDLEGTEVATWLNSIGITGIVLKYRVPSQNNEVKYLQALQDAQRAVSVVRSQAQELGLDEKRIGILGFSAGGEVAARTSLQYNTRKYESIDNIDTVSCRPDFSVLIYPAYLVNKENQLHEELKPATDAPPTLMVHAWDDPVTPLSSLCLATELKKVGVSCEVHVFALGGHGYGLRHVDGMPVTDWAQQASAWLGQVAAKK